MNTYYIKLAKYLDKIGKFSQADNVDNFIKSAQQYTYTAPGLQSGRKIEYQGYLDATGQARQTAGFGAGLQAGVGQESAIVGFQPLTPQQYYELAQQPGGAQLIFDYNKQLGEDIAKEAAQYTGPNRFEQFINIVAERIRHTPDPNMQKQIFENYIQVPLIAELKTIIMYNPVQNIKLSLSKLTSSYLNYFLDNNEIPKAFYEALSSMQNDANVQVKQRYNELLANPDFSNYTRGFSPVQ